MFDASEADGGSITQDFYDSLLEAVSTGSLVYIFVPDLGYTLAEEATVEDGFISIVFDVFKLAIAQDLSVKTTPVTPANQKIACKTIGLIEPIPPLEGGRMYDFQCREEEEIVITEIDTEDTRPIRFVFYTENFATRLVCPEHWIWIQGSPITKPNKYYFVEAIYGLAKIYEFDI